MRVRPLLLLLALPLLALALTWPLPLVFRTHVLAAPDQEAATHIWGLWAALAERAPLVIHTRLLAWPDGVTVVLVDPANLPAFALGDLLGPAAGYNAVLLSGVALMGLAGALLAREVGGSAALGAVVAMACPTVLSNAADGMTEGFAVGWVGVQLALLLAYLRGGRRRDGLLAALALALAWYGGPYNGLFASGLDLAVGAGLLARGQGRARRRILARLLAVGGAAALVAAPLAWAVLTQRSSALPGSLARAGLSAVVENPAIFRGGVRTGADLLDLWLPGPLTGGVADVSHTAYLGVAVLIAAVAAVIQDRRRWPWLAGALAFAALALGPHLYFGGRALRLGGRPLLGPAGGLILAIPFFGRLTRWYRAGAVATLLLSPLVSTWGSARSRTAVLLGAAVLADTLVLAPMAWPLQASPLPDARPYAALQGSGALYELPRTTTGPPPPGGWRDVTALAQTLHGHPIAGAVMGLQDAAVSEEFNRSVQRLLRTGAWLAADRARMTQAGFRWLAIWPDRFPLPPSSQGRLRACLGDPVAQGEEIWIYSLEGGQDGRDCKDPAAQPD